jgi:hypothetical protein
LYLQVVRPILMQHQTQVDSAVNKAKKVAAAAMDQNGASKDD